MHFDLVAFIQAIGYIGIFVVVFIESGIFFGFFFPGDSLLFTAGFLASRGYFNIWTLVALSLAGAIFGVSAGYAFGKKFGPKLFSREDSLFFHKDHLERTRIFFEKHGGKTLILARFIPIVRTFAPIFAGVGRMPYKIFVFYNVVGGVLWTGGLLFAGFFLGKTIPDVDKYLLPIVLGIIVISLMPTAYHMLKEPKQRALLVRMALRILGRNKS